MKENPLVSVVIAFYNEEDLLHEAIESVILQDYDNWELLLVDDGSIDQSSSIAKKYSEAYDGKISYLEHEGHQNRGLSASRNLGIQVLKATSSHFSMLTISGFLANSANKFPCSYKIPKSRWLPRHRCIGSAGMTRV
jgi:glycosyltransferase involved in cell wall biosynthesis